MIHNSAKNPGDTAPRTGRVLIVDDDIDLAESLQEILEGRGYISAVAHDIAGAHKAAAALMPQVAILDINLGSENGLSLITTLKEAFPDLLSVVITARAEMEHSIETLRRGAFDFLLKPLHPLETLSRLDRCFEKIALQERAEKAEAASEAKSAFLAVVSHELRTPLNAIIGFSGLMEDERFGPLGSPRYRDYATDIKQSGEHLLELINNILDLTRAEAGHLNLHEEAIDIGDLARDCVRKIQLRAETTGLEVQLSVPPTPLMLLGDAPKLRRILFNLLTNAMKFTPQGGRIALRVAKGGDGGIQCIVEDTGVGMAQTDIPRALQVFTQLDSGLARRHGGTGLGLPLTNSLVLLHGGQFELISALGNGTTAIVTFPPARTLDDTSPSLTVAHS